MGLHDYALIQAFQNDLGDCDEMLEDIRKVKEWNTSMQSAVGLVTELTEGMQFHYLERHIAGPTYIPILTSVWTVPGREQLQNYLIEAQASLPLVLHSVLRSRAERSSDFGGVLFLLQKRLMETPAAISFLQGTLFDSAVVSCERALRIKGPEDALERRLRRYVDARLEYILAVFWEFCSDAFRAQCVELWRSANLYENIVDRTQEKQ